MSVDFSDSHKAPTATEPLTSTLASDPDMADLLEFFVDEIGDRIETIRSTSQGNDLGGLRSIAHQLKGAATGYGFAPISETAGELERLIDTTAPVELTPAIREQVDELIGLCQRVSK